MTSRVHMRRYDPNVPEDLKFVTENGAIWQTPYAQLALDAIRAGTIKVEDLKNVPPNIQAILDRAEPTDRAPVFKDADASVEHRDWSCSTHTDPPVRLLSRKGRSYLMCSQVKCEEFERSQ